MAELTVNTEDVARARAQFLGMWGALDAKRPTAWEQYGYKQDLAFEDFRRAYERGGAAHGAVHNLLDRCWSEWPRIKRPGDDDESDWEKAVKKLFTDTKSWQRLRDFDRRNMVGRFAALIYRIADGKKLEEPLNTGKLVGLIPLYEDQIKVVRWDDNTESETFGQPLMWQYKVRSPSTQGNTDAAPDNWAEVHPSRVQILAEGSAGGDFFEGVPLLKAGFNSLVDIEKLSGGGAESALKNSARTISFEYDPQAQVAAITSTNPDGSTSTKSVKQHHEDQAKALNRNQDASIVMQGGKATTLQTQVSDLSPQFEIAANLFAASVQIPFTILFGQQTGRLASDEDKTAINARCRGRQKNELTPMMVELVTRLQAAGCIEKGEFEIEWTDLGAPTDAERVDVLVKLTDAMQKAFQSGLTEPLFDANELRKRVDFEERSDDGMPSPEDLAKSQADEEAARAAKAGKGPNPAAKP